MNGLPHFSLFTAESQIFLYALKKVLNPSDVKNILCHEYFNVNLLTNGYAFEEMEIWGFFLPLNFVVVVRASEDCARSFRGLQPPLILLIQSAHAH